MCAVAVAIVDLVAIAVALTVAGEHDSAVQLLSRAAHHRHWHL